jgi:hypothetical protein
VDTPGAFEFDAIDAKPEPTGAEVTFTEIVKVSLSVAIGAVIVTGIFEVTPGVSVGIVPTATLVGVIAFPGVAEAGATEVNTPKPKAATATSATRLKVVFVDICFLSISRSREFPPLGLGSKVPSHMS